MKSGGLEIKPCPPLLVLYIHCTVHMVMLLYIIIGLSVEFEESVYSVVENNCITINIITSSSFAVPFSVNIIETSVSMDYFLQGVPVTMSPDGSSNNFTFCARQDDIKEINEMFILELEVIDDGGLNISLGGIMSTEVTVVDISGQLCQYNTMSICVTFDVIYLASGCLL